MTTGNEQATRQDPHALQTLSPVECFDLLEPGGVGRVAFNSAGEIMILPVNFALTGKTIIFRTAPDTLLALYADGPVSYEADRLDDALREGWSVLVHGHARKVTDERDVRAFEDRRASSRGRPAPRRVRRITASRMSGRRILPTAVAGR